MKAGEAAINFVDRNLCKDGSHRWVNWNVIPVPDREIIFGIGEDITERKLAEEMLKKAHEELEEKVQDRTAELTAAHEALRQSNDELQSIYNGMSDGLLIADTETQQFVQANASICRMLGYSKKELLSKSVRDIHPAEDIPAVLEAFRMVSEGRRHGSVEMPMLRKDGGTFVADISENRAIYNGRPCLIGFFRDITWRNESQ